jgi:hypothetical protein
MMISFEEEVFRMALNSFRSHSDRASARAEKGIIRRRRANASPEASSGARGRLFKGKE